MLAMVKETARMAKSVFILAVMVQTWTLQTQTRSGSLPSPSLLFAAQQLSASGERSWIHGT
jgi:hypothetical protein